MLSLGPASAGWRQLLPALTCLSCFAAAVEFQSIDRDALSEYVSIIKFDADSTMSKTSPVDAKREEFRKYLEKEGVLDSLTKALVALYEEPEKPNDAVSYLKTNFAGHEALVLELEEVKKELAITKDELTTTKTELDKYRSETEQLRTQLEEEKANVSKARAAAAAASAAATAAAAASAAAASAAIPQSEAKTEAPKPDVTPAEPPSETPIGSGDDASMETN